MIFQYINIIFCSEHGAKIDVMTVLETTPPKVQLEHLARYLESALEKRVAQRHHSQLLRGLMHAEHLQVQDERIKLESNKVVLTEELICPICHKKFRSAAEAAFVRLPNGHVIHYACKEKALVM